MNLLLETHTLLWHSTSDPQLSTTATQLLGDSHNELFLSMATSWEIAIKSGLRKLALTAPYTTFMTHAINTLGLTVLPITLADCDYYESLPFPHKNHRDPFDRMIITHARKNGLSIVGNDVAFDAYGVTRLW